MMDGQAKLIDDLNESIAIRDQLLDLKDTLIEQFKEENDNLDKQLQSLKSEVSKMQDEQQKSKLYLKMTWNNVVAPGGR